MTPCSARCAAGKSDMLCVTMCVARPATAAAMWTRSSGSSPGIPAMSPGIVGERDLGVGEEFPYRGGDSSRGGHRPPARAHDDPFPLIQQRVGPESAVDAVLGEREYEVHDGEREEHVRVDENPGQGCH